MKIGGFVVHLKRAAARRSQADRLVAELPVRSSILDAVDGLALTEAEAAVYQPNLHRPSYPFGLRRQEIGVFLSHRKAWRAIVDEGLDFGLVVEDDVRLEQSFPLALTFVTEHAHTGDYVRFPRWARAERGAEIAADPRHSIFLPRVAGLGAQAQLVGRMAARRLLAFTETFDRPVDTTVQMTWLHGVRVLCARPVVIEEIDHLVGGSVTQGKSRLWRDILGRELKRAAYRTQVRISAWRGANGGRT
jgi:GR25 family glycosyltransferase involved in LPS biosynthesis